jgi:hypothetical protein
MATGEVPRNSSGWVFGVAVKYQLKFFTSDGRATRRLDIHAPDDDAAIHVCCIRSIEANADIELWKSGDLIIRMTPLTARLYGCDNEHARHV